MTEYDAFIIFIAYIDDIKIEKNEDDCNYRTCNMEWRINSWAL